MASKLAIALKQQSALKRIEDAVSAISTQIGIEQAELPQSGRDEALLQAQRLESIATWAEQVLERIKELTDERV